MSYDAPWPVRKVPLRCTPHFVTYHLESKTYCLVTSIAEPTKQYYKFNGEDKELSVEDKGDRLVFVMIFYLFFITSTIKNMHNEK